MTDDYIIVLPVLNRQDLVDSCIESIDVDKAKHLMLVDNSPNGLFQKYIGQVGWHIQAGKNLGVASSWNLGLKQGREWTIILSAAVRWKEGISKFIEQLPQDPEKHLCQLYINGVAPSWHCLAFRKSLVEMIGYFDENFFPACMEDVDYGTRLKIARVAFKKELAIYRIDVPSAENRGFALTVSGGKVQGVSPENDRRLMEYYQKKWGGDKGVERFSTPFNSGKTLSFWEPYTPPI